MEDILPKNSLWRAEPHIHRIGKCHCGYPVFFRNYLCLHCGRALGYEPGKAAMLALEVLDNDGNFCMAGAPEGGAAYRRCANFDLAPQCNWLIPAADRGQHVLCRCCRLNRTIPDQSIAANAPLWQSVERAKRRLVSSLIAFGLPVASRMDEDTERGMAFDLLADIEPTPVTTGHFQGIITVNVNEADDAAREAIRTALHEPYRTLLGHVRHESGHYYWHRLLEDSKWLEPFRALFGDERDDYAVALQKYYANGPSLDWADKGVSAYASAHPWEDWAETWAHYLHMVDTLDTAMGSGMDGDHLNLLKDPFEKEVLYRFEGEEDDEDKGDEEFLAFFNAWAGLTSVLNEFSLGMGLPDFYPFVLSNRAINKLHFVHRFIKSARVSSDVQPNGVNQ